MDTLYNIPSRTLPTSGSSDYNKSVIVCVLDASSETANLDFLAKIMSAVGLQEDDYVLVRIASDQVFSLWNELPQDIEQNIVIFGLEPAALGLQIRSVLHRCMHLGHKQILLAQSLADTQADQGYKKALWRELQIMFAS